MKKNEDRKLAESVFLAEHGLISNKDLAAQLEVHPATVARWKKLDDWDLKLVQAVNAAEEAETEEDFYEADLRHIGLLNERIDAYLSRKELLPSEIRELAEAKYHMMNCVEIIRDQLRHSLMDDFQAVGEDYD